MCEMGSHVPVDMKDYFNRRSFLGTMGLAAASSVIPARGASTNQNSKLRILQIGVGGMGETDRNALKSHAKVEFAGLCDINQQNLDLAAKDFPKALTYNDSREALEKDIDKFDAVLVCTPDHAHAVMALHAMANDKHLFLQKPVVQQLDELRMLKRAVAAKPNLVTQIGNQRSANPGRNQAVAILRSGALGKTKTVWAWASKMAENHHFENPWLEQYYDASPVPEHIHWDLWKHCSTADVAYNEGLAHRRWRSYWEFGGGQLTDWCCHLLDVVYHALDLDVPIAVQTNTPRPATAVGHSGYNQSVITFKETPHTVSDGTGRFIVHYCDHDIHPSCAETGLPLDARFSSNRTIFVCENGTMVLGADGDMQIFQKGKKVEDFPMPEVEPRSHWHEWVDNCLGAKNVLLGDLEFGARVTEAGLLATKATRYPNRELAWDSKASAFTGRNNTVLNKNLLKREYREGFTPPAQFA